MIRLEYSTPSCVVVKFTELDELPEAIRVYGRGPKVDVLLLPLTIPGDPMRQPGYIGWRDT